MKSFIFYESNFCPNFLTFLRKKIKRCKVYCTMYFAVMRLNTIPTYKSIILCNKIEFIFLGEEWIRANFKNSSKYTKYILVVNIFLSICSYYWNKLNKLIILCIDRAASFFFWRILCFVLSLLLDSFVSLFRKLSLGCDLILGSSCICRELFNILLTFAKIDHCQRPPSGDYSNHFIGFLAYRVRNLTVHTTMHFIALAIVQLQDYELSLL